MAKSTFVNLFEALTGGDEDGAAILGVSSALTLGTGTFPLGILGVCTTGFPTAAGLTGDADVTAGLAGVSVVLGGVGGIDGSEET
jgi:hypothetical protein